MNKTNISMSLADTITKSYCEIADNCIAPGTEGKFDIVINGIGSKVSIDYKIKVIHEQNNPSNLYFYMDSNSDDKFYSLNDLFNKYDFSGTLSLNEENIKTYEIFWKWPFETINSDGSIDDVKDVEDLNYAKKQEAYIFEIEISGMQSINNIQ